MKYTDSEFHDRDIELGDIEYINCRFVNCRMTYSGGGISLNGCSFAGDQFSFSNDAATALAFLSYAYQHGGKKMIEETFNNIRAGKYYDERDEEPHEHD